MIMLSVTKRHYLISGNISLIIQKIGEKMNYLLIMLRESAGRIVQGEEKREN